MFDIIGGINAGLAAFNGLIKISENFKNAAFTKQMTDIYLQFAQFQIDTANTISENQALKEKIKEMKDNPLRYDGSMYRDNDNFPYCPACYDARDLRIHLNNSSNKICFHCPECNNNFFEK